MSDSLQYQGLSLLHMYVFEVTNDSGVAIFQTAVLHTLVDVHMAAVHTRGPAAPMLSMGIKMGALRLTSDFKAQRSSGAPARVLSRPQHQV